VRVNRWERLRYRDPDPFSPGIDYNNEFQISFKSVQTILTADLSTKRVVAKFVPKLFSDDQKLNQKQIATDLLQCSEYNELFSN
jgi:hypothetical protein